MHQGVRQQIVEQQTGIDVLIDHQHACGGRREAARKNRQRTEQMRLLGTE